MSNALENLVIDFILRAQSFTPSAVLAVALCTAAPTDASTGATITEVANANGYARQTINPSTTNWGNTQASGTGASSGTGGTSLSGVDLTWTASGGNFGTVTHIAICSSATWGAGTVYFWAPLTTSQTINDGNQFKILAGSLSVQIDN